IKLAFKVLASSKPSSIQAAALSFSVTKATLKHAKKDNCLSNCSDPMIVLSSYFTKFLKFGF
ncbi:12687_t:CDS:1, partial [Cetraspora pellucida]